MIFLSIGMIWIAGTATENQMDAGIRMLEATEEWYQSLFCILVTKYFPYFPEFFLKKKLRLTTQSNFPCSGKVKFKCYDIPSFQI